MDPKTIEKLLRQRLLYTGVTLILGSVGVMMGGVQLPLDGLDPNFAVGAMMGAGIFLSILDFLGTRLATDVEMVKEINKHPNA